MLKHKIFQQSHYLESSLYKQLNFIVLQYDFFCFCLNMTSICFWKNKSKTQAADSVNSLERINFFTGKSKKKYVLLWRKKMEILTILGSPNREGNTSELLKAYIAGVSSLEKDISITAIDIGSEDIFPCKGCFKCKTEFSKCVLDDKMNDYYKVFRRADVVVFASPIYWFNITAQLKAFFDRLIALDFQKDFKGKKIVLLSTHGGDALNSGIKIVEQIFRSFCQFLKMDMFQVYSVVTGPPESIPVKNNRKATQEAFELGKQLGDSV